MHMIKTINTSVFFKSYNVKCMHDKTTCCSLLAKVDNKHAGYNGMHYLKAKHYTRFTEACKWTFFTWDS